MLGLFVVVGAVIVVVTVVRFNGLELSCPSEDCTEEFRASVRTRLVDEPPTCFLVCPKRLRKKVKLKTAHTNEMIFGYSLWGF